MRSSAAKVIAETAAARPRRMRCEYNDSLLLRVITASLRAQLRQVLPDPRAPTDAQIAHRADHREHFAARAGRPAPRRCRVRRSDMQTLPLQLHFPPREASRLQVRWPADRPVDTAHTRAPARR